MARGQRDHLVKSSIRDFLRTWDRNISDQGYVEAPSRPVPPGSGVMSATMDDPRPKRRRE
jgi:hypothetical protein